MSKGWWALKLIWPTNASLAVGLVMSTLARGTVPAGLAVFARGLINVFVRESGVAGLGWMRCWSSSHIAGHWFLDPSRLPQDQLDAGMKTDLDAPMRRLRCRG